MKKRRFAWIMVCFLFLTGRISAYALDEYDFHEQIFTANNGLLTTATLTVAQTPDGFVWLGGYSGLTRYDGRQFLPFGSGKITNVSNLLSCDDGTLWIASGDYGLIRYRDGEIFTFDENVTEDPPMGISSLAMGTKGRPYFAAAQGVGYADENDGIVWLRDLLPEDRKITAVACGNKGELWCLTDLGEVYSCGDTATRTALPVGDEILHCMAYDTRTGKLYLGSEGNLVIICDGDTDSAEAIRVDGVNRINAFGFAENGSVYVCSDNGIARLDGTESRTLSYRVTNSVEDILVDTDGNLWFASSRQGVLLVTPSRFKDVNRLAGLGTYIVNSVLKVEDRLYIGHDNGCVILNETTFEVIEDESFATLEGKRIRQMTTDSEGRIWVCTTGDGLLCRGKDGTWTRYSTDNCPGLKSDRFRVVLETSVGMVGATDAGCFVIGEGEARALAEGLDIRVLCLAEADGAIYAGTDGEGVYVVRDGKITRHITRKDGLSSMSVLKMYECTGNKGLWMATGNTLDYLLFETGTIQHAEKFPSANVLDCLVMPDETVWVLAGNGIYQATESAILSDVDTICYSHLAKQSVPYDFTANSFSAIVGDYAYLCGTEGVALMSLTPDHSEYKNVHLVIDEMVVDGETVYIQNRDTLDIPADTRRMEISAHIPFFAQMNPTMFYYLEGFDETLHYVPASDLTNLVYTNVPGGNYTFHFGVFDPETSAPGQEIVKEMRIKHSWYERWDVRILLVLPIVLAAAGLVWLAFFLHNRKERREMERKTRELLQKRAYTDHLTELNNRNVLERFTVDRLAEREFPVIMISVDCNNLKLINDTYGHNKGDEYLKDFTAKMKARFDGEKNTLLRLGGDEFLIILEGTPVGDAERGIEDLTGDAESLLTGNIPGGFCYGMAVCEKPEEYDMAELMHEADTQMVKSKQLFHSRVYGHDEERETFDAGTHMRSLRHVKNDALSNTLFEAFAEASGHVYVFATDMNTGVTRWSPNTREYFDLPAEYIRDTEKIWIEHIHPDDRDVFAEDFRGIAEGTSTRHNCQYRALNRYNQYVWMECKGSVVRGANGKHIFAGLMTRLDNQSVYDPLTGLKTKDQFAGYIDLCEKGGAMILCVDGFADIVSTYGYRTGDAILIQTGKALVKREGKECRVFRLDGAQFAMILPYGGAEELRAVFDDVERTTREVVLDNGARLRIGFVGGGVVFDTAEDATETLLNKLTQSLECAKERKDSRFCLHSRQIQESFERRVRIKKELKESIRNDFRGFELYYQPMVSSDGKDIRGCECLLRWTCGTVTDSTPLEFIPILEESGEIVEVGRYIMREAMKRQKEWSEKYGHFFVSFNVSYLQFFTEGYTRELVETARQIGVDPAFMIIELTESCKVQAPEALADIFRELRSYGFRIALDDFGTGYASLEMLRMLPCDCVKIEHTFVRDLGNGDREIDYAIIRSILSLCKELELRVIAEGIESEKVEAIIRTMPITYLQGFYYSRPVNRGAFEKLLKERAQDGSR